MNETGIVVGLENGFATVEFERHSACASCGACMTFGERQMRVVVKNTKNAAVGDRVAVKMSASSFYEAAFLAYALPLAALLLTLFIASKLTANELIVAAAGLSGCALVYFLLRAFEPKLKQSTRFSPSMAAVLEKAV